jgi:hypothetical protein
MTIFEACAYVHIALQQRPAAMRGARSADRAHRRPATHVPEHAPREPAPRQEPLPELVDKRPLPFAYEPPEETLT